VAFIFVGSFFFVNPVVILVHGSFSSHSSWWRPGGSFFEPLQNHAEQLGHTVVPFMWSGQPDSHSIHLAGELLAALIKSYSQEVILIGHSHGGNVINVASQKLKQQQVLHANPLNLALDVHATTRDQKKYLIKRAYLLGTPVEQDFYSPNMDIIESVINFYSKGDHIQPMLGFFDRIYSGVDRIANISVSFKKQSELDAKEPGHCRLYDPIVARLILFIPDVLKEHDIGNFQMFSYLTGGHVLFDELMGAFYLPVS